MSVATEAALEEGLSKAGIWIVKSQKVGIDTLLEYFITKYQDFTPQHDLWKAAREMQTLRDADRTTNRRPRAPLAWLPTLTQIESAVR